jgi:hypothetical protein
VAQPNTPARAPIALLAPAVVGAIIPIVIIVCTNIH